MTAALVGAASCARCGTGLGRSAALCPACGSLLLPAASGRVLGTSTPLLAGVARATPVRRYLALALDLVPLVAGVAVAVRLGVRGAYAGLALALLLTFAYAGLELALLAARGRTLGRLALGLRTVDDLTAQPPSVVRLAGRLVGRRGPRTVTARLAGGRDPLQLAPAALLGTDLAEGPTPDAAVFAPAGVAEAGPLTPSEAVTLVFDSGRRQVVRSTLLIGRSPENSPGLSRRDPRRPAADHPLLGLADLSRTLSKTHVLVEWSGVALFVTDLQSANGTVLISPAGDRRPLVPGVPGAAGLGWTVQCGARSFAVHAVSEQGGTTSLGPSAARQQHPSARPQAQP